MSDALGLDNPSHPDHRPELRVQYLREGAQTPARATPGSAGMDLCCVEGFSIKPGEIKLIATGLAFEFDHGYEVQIRPRSGLALKHGVTVLNAPGTVDSDYRGEVGVILINLGREPFACEGGSRIAQAVMAPVLGPRIVHVHDLTPTQRGEGGYGSTGQ